MDNNNKKHQLLIDESWQRCRDFGLSHDAQPDWQSLAKADTHILQETHRDLISTTAHAVLPYYDNILNNSPCLILLADHQGHVLNSWGERRFLSIQQNQWFSSGANWRELTAGTNAIGTALASKEAVQIQRDEHFLKRHRYMIGSAAPIFDANKELLGVLDISSDTYMPQAHTLGMVRLMSQSIENRLIIDKYHPRNFMLTLNTHSDNLDSQWSGLVVISPLGLVVSSNRRAEQLLDCRLLNKHVEELLAMSMNALSAKANTGPLKVQVLGKYQLYIQLSAPTDAGKWVAMPQTASRVPKQDSHIAIDELEFGDPRMQRAIFQAQKVIEKDIPVLVHGETGVGKEVFVSALHRASSRAKQPFVALNCAAIPADLVESELFGYVKGAFTGADTKGAIGLIRKADKGVLFLDEIGDMPLSVQARLLRVLQERSVVPLGATTAYPVDIKLVSATNCNLKQLVSQGQFRKDLFYRVSGLSVELPSLSQRSDKVALFNQIISARRLATGCDGASTATPDKIMQLFLQHPWPGNIRQFISVIDVALALAEDDPIEQWHLPDDFFADLNEEEGEEFDFDEPDAGQVAPSGSMEESESQQTLNRYRQFSGNISKAAKALGISRNTMYKRLRELGVK
ncbi:MAG: sigma-54-dependent Fis family transcriptional regulator [Pseudomonadales bacterium]